MLNHLGKNKYFYGVFLALLNLPLLSYPAHGQSNSCIDSNGNNIGLGAGHSISFDVLLENQKIGEIYSDVFPDLTNPQSRGIRAKFTTTNGKFYNDFLQDTLKGAVGLNWLQFLNVTSTDPNAPDDPFVDPPEGGGVFRLWADNTPWYWNANQPDDLSQATPDGNGNLILPSGKLFDPDTMLDEQLELFVNGSTLHFSDYPQLPPGDSFSFSTFLIAEFPGKKYDILSSLGWQAGSEDIEVNGKPQTITCITHLKKDALFHLYLENLVSSFDDGYSKILKLAPYKFSGNLSPGAVDSFTRSGLPTPLLPIESINYVAWINNTIGSNTPGNPDTVLGQFTSSGQLLFPTNDNGGPYGSNNGSAFLGSVNPDGTVNLKVTGDPAYDDGNFDGVYVYEDEVCSGGSGGGGCQTVIRTDPHQESGEYELFVKLFDTSKFEIGSTPFQSFLSSAPNDAFLQSLRLPKATKNVSEPTSIFALLVLGLGGIGLKRNNKKDKEQ
ncbi:PEP-CTERM sorting domain-containing protein [Lusitaniella coriacea]|uniref:PEP-CTERM sorting domain-containing protein n=1 Tax=Lusitaniella coriacea TaxID=1983105 RepID=UPI003CF1C3D8